MVTLHVNKSNELAIQLYTSLALYTSMLKPGFCGLVFCGCACALTQHKSQLQYDGEDALIMSLVLQNDVDID